MNEAAISAFLALASASIAVALWLRPDWFYRFQETTILGSVHISIEKIPQHEQARWARKCKLAAIVFLLQATFFVIWFYRKTST